MVRSFALLSLVGCAPDLLIDEMGACELQYSEIGGVDGPVPFCLRSAWSECSWVQSSHGGDDLGFWPHEPCHEVGFPVCCGTETLDLWFESPVEADAARTEISGEGCLPCDRGPT